MRGSQKRTEFETEWFSIESERFDSLPHLNGKPIYRVNVPDSSAVVALTGQKQLILVRQFRPALNRWSLEFPAGSISHGETAEKAAHRELLEETGYRCESLQFVHTGCALVDRVNSQINIFFGENAHPESGFHAEPGVEVVLANLNQLKHLVLSGEFKNIPALGMVLWSHWKLRPEAFSQL